jgi:site-specific recombinase XerD
LSDLVPRPAASVAIAKPVMNRAELIAAAFLAAYGGRTAEAYSCDLRQYFTWCAGVDVDPVEASRAHVQVYARELEQAGRSRSTVARKLSTLAGFYGYAVVEDVIARSPLAHVRRPRVPDESPRFGLDRFELGRLLATGEEHSAIALALVCLLALNGLRISEACNADIDDLDEDRGHRLLTVTRKGGKRQRIPLAPRTAAAVTALPSVVARAPRPAGLAAPTLSAAGPAASLLGLDRFAAWRLTRRLAESAGITKTISPHSLRHTFVTLALDAGVELRDVQDAAGHADPRTTRRYDRGRDSLDRAATYRLAAFIDT